MADAPTDPTTSGPAPAEGEQPVGGSRLDLVRARARSWFGHEVVERRGSFLVDLASLVAVAWAIWWFADNDGGLALSDQRPFGGFLLLLAPLLVREWTRINRLVAWLLVALPLGAILSIAFAIDRSRFVNDALSFGAVPVLVLLASRLARRRWSLVTMTAVIGVGFLAWSWLAGLRWWGWTDLGAQPRWEFVSWRNPSGMLAGAFGVWAAGILLAGRRSPSLLAGAFAALGLAGAYLSSSRGAILFAIAGVLICAGLTIGATSTRRPAAALSVAGRVTGLVIASVLLVTALNSMLPEGTASPIESRTETVAGNAITRTKHWEAALRMFADRPITGIGLGSYREMASSYNPPDGRLTSAAHSAWFEGLGEGGLVFGLPLIALAGMLALGVLRLPSRVGEPEDDSSAFGLARASVIGTAGAAAALVAHASLDFDFRYPTILTLACLAAGATLSQFTGHDDFPTETQRPDWKARAAIVPAVALLGIGWVSAGPYETDPDLEADGPVVYATARAPWDTNSRVFATQVLRDLGETDAAYLAAEGPARWNPGNPRAVMNLARLEYATGRRSADELLGALEEPPTVLREWTLTARELFEGGDYRQAEIAARRAIGFHPEYEVWGIEHNVLGAWQVLVEVGVLAKGCDEGAELVAQAHAQAFDPGGPAEETLDRWFTTQICP